MKDEKIVLSPALGRIISKHFEGMYNLYEVDSFFRTYINKEDVIREINARYAKMFNNYENIYARNTNTLTGVRKWRQGMRMLITDLKGLSHTDFDVLRYIKTEEAMQRTISTINNKPIEFSKEA
jgi:hypothetical protein